MRTKQSERHPHTIALILSGGTGQRVGADLPKQYIEINGESILHHTLHAFEGLVDDILVVCQDQWRESVGPYRTCSAGNTGFESLQHGIWALSDESPDTIVLIHDAVRPLVSQSVILDNLRVARECGNAIAAIGTYETLLCAHDGSTARNMIRREGMYRAQTPQTFTLGTLRQMMQEAKEHCIIDAQSACTLACQLGYELHLSQGDIRNFKITVHSDLELYEAIIS